MVENKFGHLQTSKIAGSHRPVTSSLRGFSVLHSLPVLMALNIKSLNITLNIKSLEGVESPCCPATAPKHHCSRGDLHGGMGQNTSNSV